MSTAPYPDSKVLSKEIVRLYFEKLLSVRRVANLLKIGPYAVQVAIEQAGLSLRPRNEAVRLSKPGPSPVHGSDLEDRRADGKWETKHNETGSVACRICGERQGRLGPHGSGRRDRDHLAKAHGMTVHQYRQFCRDQGWDVPPITCSNYNESIAHWRSKHVDRVKSYGHRKNARDKERRRTDPGFTKHEGETIRRKVQRKLSEADKKRRVQCRSLTHVRGCHAVSGIADWRNICGRYTICRPLHTNCSAQTPL